MSVEQGARSAERLEEKRFRFQDLEVWQRAVRLSATLFALADRLEKRRRFRFAEQLRSATLSITNNIAEGSGSASQAEFAHLLNISRRSVYEVANMLHLFAHEKLLTHEEIGHHLAELEEQSRMLNAFIRTLRS